jgi:hypothetical protein
LVTQTHGDNPTIVSSYYEPTVIIINAGFNKSGGESMGSEKVFFSSDKNLLDITRSKTSNLAHAVD